MKAILNKSVLNIFALASLMLLQIGCASTLLNRNVVKSSDEISLTSANAPLPESAFKAEISLPHPLPTLKAGEHKKIHVVLKNTGDTTWPAFGQRDGKYQVRLGNHWLDENGKTFANDDGRSPLPFDLKAGDEAELLLTVTAPKTSGEYILELDVVQEQVAWFQDKGSATLRVKLRVE